jgi:hypothetical protein
MRHWTTLLETERDGFTIIVDKTWEDAHPRDCFDDNTDPMTGKPYNDVELWCEQIDRGELDWFMARARVLVDGVELSDACLGGLLYADAREFLTDGMGEDLILDALEEAKSRLTTLAKKFTMLAIKHA